MKTLKETLNVSEALFSKRNLKPDINTDIEFINYYKDKPKDPNFYEICKMKNRDVIMLVSFNNSMEVEEFVESLEYEDFEWDNEFVSFDLGKLKREAHTAPRVVVILSRPSWSSRPRWDFVSIDDYFELDSYNDPTVEYVECNRVERWTYVLSKIKSEL